MADIELARAYVEIIPVTKGISQKTKEQIFPDEKDSRGPAERAGRGFTNHLGKALKRTAAGVGIAAGGLLATSLVKGFGRLAAIENAESKLRGLGNSAEDVSAIMDNALGAVKGTAFGMDEAATTAASAVAAGIKPGKELESYLRLVGDAATIAGTDMSSMGGIFNKVATSGKIQGEVFNQLGDKGIPIVALLADQMGVTAGEIYKMGAAGEIGTEDFLAAMSSMSGAALEGGNTTMGAFKNMGAALSRFGAELLSGIYPLIGPFFSAITGVIDKATDAVGPFIESITPGMQAAAGAALDMVTTLTGSVSGIAEVFRSGDFDPSKWAEGITEDSPLVGAAFAIRDAWETVRDTMTPVVSAIRDAIVAVIPYARDLWDWFSELSLGAKALFGGSVLAGGLAAFGQLGATLGLVAGKVKGLMGPLGKFAPLLRFLGGPIGLIVGGLVTLIATNDDVRASFGNLFEVLVDVLGSTLSTLAPVIGDLAVQLGPVLGAAAIAVGSALQALAPVVVWVVDAVASLLEWMQPALPLLVGVAGGALLLVKVFGVLAPIFTTVFGVVMKVVGVLSKIGPLITAMTGPVGWIIIGVTALGVALWAFFTKTETGRKLWDQIWGGIKNAVAVVVDWITGTAWPAIQAAWSAIAAGALWLYDNAILPAWNGIRTAIGVVAEWITGTVWPALQAAWSAIGAAASWLYTNIMQPVWTGIKTAIAIAVTAVLVYIDLLKWYFSNVIAPVALWLWHNVISPAWAGIQTAIGAVVAWVRDTAWPILKGAFDAIAAGAMWLWQNVLAPAWAGIKIAIGAVVSWLTGTAWPFIQKVWTAIADGATWLWKSVIVPVWSGIQSAIRAVVDWLRNTAWPLVQKVIGWLQLSFEGWKMIAEKVWGAVRSAVDAVVGWFRDTAWPAIRNVIDNLKAGFRLMRDTVRNVWDEVKTKIINPVATWFRDTIGGLFDRVTGGIGDAFGTLRDTVKTAWEGIRDSAKKPVEFLVETIIRDGIIDKYNSVAHDVFGLDKIDRDKFTVGWARGGYTGPGAKHQEAGVVHADEFVIRKESQNSLRNAAPGFLDALNRHGARALDALGYAGGGLVKLRNPFAGSYPRGDGFGARGGRHKGIDWPMPSGAVLKAVGAGTVSHTRNAAAGNKLELSVGNGLVAGYHHLSSYIAGQGSHVGPGADVARVGSTGRSSGPHLHFSLKKDGSYVDPAPYLGAGGAAGDGSGGGWWNPFDGLWDSLKDKVRAGVGDSPFGDTLFEVPKKVIGGAVNWATEKLSALGDWGAEAVGAVTGRARWVGLATQALGMTGNAGPRNLNSMLNRMMQESGGDPRAINNWDSNAKRGTPSKGLMQVIDPTFQAYRDRRAPNDIWDPLANFLASIHYTKSTYGSLRAGWNRAGGYWDGGLVAGGREAAGGVFDNGGWLNPGQVAVNLSNRPEPVFNGAQWDVLAQNLEERGGRDRFGDINVTVEPREGDDPGTFGRRVGEALELELLSL